VEIEIITSSSFRILYWRRSIVISFALYISEAYSILHFNNPCRVLWLNKNRCYPIAKPLSPLSVLRHATCISQRFVYHSGAIRIRRFYLYFMSLLFQLNNLAIGQWVHQEWIRVYFHRHYERQKLEKSRKISLIRGTGEKNFWNFIIPFVRKRLILQSFSALQSVTSWKVVK
jgi:hypothetical protein